MESPTRAALSTTAVDICADATSSCENQNATKAAACEEGRHKKCVEALGDFAFVRGTQLSSLSKFHSEKLDTPHHPLLTCSITIFPAGAYFGGISSLSACAAGDDSLLAGVIDWGQFITFPRYPPLGADACSATLYPMLDEAGAAVGTAKRLGDAEALTCDADGAVLVSFERLQRVWRYPSPAASDPAAATGAAAAAANASSQEAGLGSSAFLSRAVDAHLGSVLAACNGDSGECSRSALCFAYVRTSQSRLPATPAGNHGVESMEMINATHLLAICEGPEVRTQRLQPAGGSRALLLSCHTLHAVSPHALRAALTRPMFDAHRIRRRASRRRAAWRITAWRRAMLWRRPSCLT